MISTDIRYDQERRVVVLTGLVSIFAPVRTKSSLTGDGESIGKAARGRARKVRVWRKNLLRLYRRLKRRGITAAIQCRMSDTNLISQRIIREQGGRRGLEQFAQKNSGPSRAV